MKYTHQYQSLTMYGPLTEISVIGLCLAVILEKGLTEELKCSMTSATRHDDIVECNGVLFQHVCLICNISRLARNVGWYVNNRQLTQDKYILQDDHAGGIDINQCHSEMYSLRLKNPSTENDNVSYSCLSRGDNVSQFILKLKAETKLHINSTSIFHGKLLVNERDGNQSVRCVIEGAVPPFSLTWSLNGVVQGKKAFNYSAEAFSFDFVFESSNLIGQNVATCSSQGKFIVPDSTSLLLQTDDTGNEPFPTGGTGSPKKVDWILIPSVAIILSVVVVFIAWKGIVKYRSSERLGFIPNWRTGSQGEDNGSTTDPYCYVEHFANGAFSESDQTSITVATCLDTKVSVNGLYEYWTGTFSTAENIQGKCFGRRLSDQGTLQEASEFKLLARRLFALEKSENIVAVFAINIETEPFAIVYEFLEYGSLRDFVMTRYQQTNTDTEDEMAISLEEQLKELLTFAVNIARAMAFIESQEFCHPFVSLRKVLLTSQCGCKLYDIRPNDMAMIRVKEVLKKTNPPIAWMPPETIFLREYTPICDSWSFSVLLWELFSLGDTPYAGNTSAELERIIREGNLLPRPKNCPESAYETMLLSWHKRVEKRPSFAVLYGKLEDILKATQEAGDAKGKTYFTLNSNENGDYI